MINNQNARVEMEMENFGSKLSSGIVLCSKGVWKSSWGLEIVCFDADNLCISKEKDGVFERVRSTRYRLIAMLLDFEEKWEYGFNA